MKNLSGKLRLVISVDFFQVGGPDSIQVIPDRIKNALGMIKQICIKLVKKSILCETHHKTFHKVKDVR